MTFLNGGKYSEFRRTFSRWLNPNLFELLQNYTHLYVCNMFLGFIYGATEGERSLVDTAMVRLLATDQLWEAERGRWLLQALKHPAEWVLAELLLS